MMQREPSRVKVPIYRAWGLLLAVGWTGSEMALWLQEQGADRDEVNSVEHAGAAVFEVGSDLVIWIPEPYDMGIIVHEAMHAGLRILRTHGVKIESENDEPITYFCQWVVERILNEVQLRRLEDIREVNS